MHGDPPPSYGPHEGYAPPPQAEVHHPAEFYDGGGDDARPEYFAGMEEMLVYFEGVTAAVVNYSPEDTDAIRNELQMLGARVRERYTPDCTHLMTPYQQGRDYKDAAAEGKIVVSYAWLEDCLTARRVVPHTDKVLYQPIRDENGVPGMESAVISIAGYKGPIRNDIRELIEATGATFNQNFTKKTTHLVCYRAESEVYAKALLFKLEGQMLEIVNHRWIEDSAKQWRKMPEESEVYRKLGVEVDFEERLDAEKRLRMDVEAQLEEEERSRRNLQELLEQEESARQEMQQQLMEEEAKKAAKRRKKDAKAGKATTDENGNAAGRVELVSGTGIKSSAKREWNGCDDLSNEQLKAQAKRFRAADHAPEGADEAVYASLFTGTNAETRENETFLSRNARRGW